MTITKLVSADVNIGDYVTWKDNEATAHKCTASNAKGACLVVRKAWEPTLIWVEERRLPRCDECKHWKHRGIRSYCEHPALRLRASLLFVPPIETDKDFGCVQWEAK